MKEKEYEREQAKQQIDEFEFSSLNMIEEP